MSDSDDDWFTKDVDSFEVPVDADEPLEGSAIPKEKLLDLLKGSETGTGTYKQAEKKISKKKIPGKLTSGKNDENFVQKLPITKLATIAGLSSLKSFCEALLNEEELLETLKVAKMTDRYLELSTNILENICSSPFVEHKREFLEKLRKIDNFWSQFLKNHKKLNCDKLKKSLNLHEANLSNWEKLKQELQESFVEVPEMIVKKDELLASRPILRPNITKGQFATTEEYKSLHLALLKEDFVSTVRESLAKYNEKFDEPFDGPCDDIKVHLKVKLRQGNPFGRGHEVYIKLPKHAPLFHGSLLIFTTNLKTLDGYTLGITKTLARHKEDNEENLVPIEIIVCEHANIFDEELIMIQCEAFYDPYFQTYKVLASSEIPFAQYLVDLTLEKKFPKYVEALANPHYSHRHTIFNVMREKPMIKGFNESQSDAYYTALTQEFCLIQGPPGTGKTFIGLQIVETLLKNTDMKILIVCQTNHALDQFLVGIKQFTEDIVRLGSQSRNLLLEEFNIKELTEENMDHRLYFKTRNMYQEWTTRFIRLQTSSDTSQDAITEAQRAMRSLSKKLDELHQIRQCQLIGTRRVIGMTTSFAARSHALLELLAIPIIIFEEAAEVLESHIVASLTPSTQHVILIGDHQQLRPTTSVHRLAREYKMDISLFERMVNNNMNYECLKEQHRMRPEISDLIRTTIYPILIDAEQVTRSPNVVRMKKNVFFLDHQELESNHTDETTKKNKFEAKHVAKLCMHLLDAGYQPAEITILTPYQGQANSIVKLVKDTGVHVDVVDNFQGEENKIVLLSLVRSNKNRSIGFLAMANRICVALSRAREGLYIFGNMNFLSDCSPIWKMISEKLHAGENIGPKLPFDD